MLLDTKENPRLCRGDTKAYGVEESKKEKVSKLEQMKSLPTNTYKNEETNS